MCFSFSIAAITKYYRVYGLPSNAFISVLYSSVVWSKYGTAGSLSQILLAKFKMAGGLLSFL
jgi:hypothetical protein